MADTPNRMEDFYGPVRRTWFDRRFPGRWQGYLAQSFAAALVLGAILAYGHVLINGAIVAAIAASTALTFFAPHSVAASARRMIGGHAMGVSCAGIVWAILRLCHGDPYGVGIWVEVVAGAFAVGLVILVMSATNTEHAPAAGTTLGLIVDRFPMHDVTFILTAVLILAFVRVVLARRMRNLV